MSELDVRTYWENVYRTKGEREVSWFEESPAISLDLIHATGVKADASIIDIGGGASRLVDALLDEGFEAITVLDLSNEALATSEARLGLRSAKVRWIAVDVTTWEPSQTYDVWHDRATFHFLTRQVDQAAYAARVSRAVRPGGHVIIGTFAAEGPERCSGLPVVRHNADSLGQMLGPSFKLVESRHHLHQTPMGIAQHFQFSHFLRMRLTRYLGQQNDLRPGQSIPVQTVGLEGMADITISGSDVMGQDHVARARERLATDPSLTYASAMNHQAVIIALLSAALFGISTPAAKALLGSIDPTVLAGLLYCGAGVGVAMLRRFARPLIAGNAPTEAPLSYSEMPWLSGAIVAGGIVGPVLLMAGLARTDASAASLLLTLEGAATALMAWFVFHENFEARIALGMACLVAGTAVLAWVGTPTVSGLIGPLAIAGACIAWGLDNNLTRKVSLADPLQIVELKGLIAGPVNLALGLWFGGSLPGLSSVLLAGVVGFLGYGVSLVLFVIALRHLGAARTGAYFSTAPFLGAIVAVLALHEPVTRQLVIAGGLMALGVWLHLTETHVHEHEHEPLEHSHLHMHDEHHQHEHGPDDPAGEPHTHMHRHARLRHTHPHTPDMHHTHRH